MLSIEEKRTKYQNSFKEQKEARQFITELENWLCKYTTEVIKKVYENIDEIYDNTTARKLIHELYEREEKEHKQRQSSMFYVLIGVSPQESGLDQIQNHILTHSDSYRNILYDMFIR